MTGHEPDGATQLDLGTITRDDLLLDVLMRGEEGADADDLAALLAAWRADVTADADDTGASDRLPPSGPTPAGGGGRIAIRSGRDDATTGHGRRRRPRPSGHCGWPPPWPPS
ncbi:hypothetical protein, partial [Micromonospora sp. 4G55]|uniref:hypothetical protein n=1 Tax=Micromonospora sp. 4G55 TaxID=2806102 RepID=UPI001A591298